MGECVPELMVERRLQSTALKHHLAQRGGFQQQLACASIKLDTARLFVMTATIICVSDK